MIRPAGGVIPIPGAAKTGKFVGIAIKELGPKIKNIWSFTKSLNPVENALHHFYKHKNEFPELKNAKQYVEKARSFMHSRPQGTLI